MSKIRAAIIFGGVSNEYETSLLAAASIMDNIDTEEYETVCIGITRKGRWLYYPGTSEDILNDTWSENPDCTPVVISPDPNRNGIIKIEDGEASFFRVDVIFPVLYGKNGEDGTIAGLLRITGIPYVGSDLMASAACICFICSNCLFASSSEISPASNWLWILSLQLSEIVPRIL